MLRILSFVIFSVLAFVSLELMMTATGNALPFVGGYIGPYISSYLPATLAVSAPIGTIFWMMVYTTSLALLGLSVTGVTGSMRILYLMVSFVAGFAFIVSPFLAINGFAANYPNLFEWTTFTAPYIATSFILAILISWPFSAKQKAEKTVDVEYQPEMDDVENIADESLTHNTEDTRDLCGKDEKL